MPLSRQHRAENMDKITANTPAKRRREDWKDKNTTSASGASQRRSASVREPTKASSINSTRPGCLLASAVTALPQVLCCLESVNCENYAASPPYVHKSQSPKPQHGNRYESECIGIGTAAFHWGELFHWQHLPRQPRANAARVILSEVHAQIPGSVESGAEEENLWENMQIDTLKPICRAFPLWARFPFPFRPAFGTCGIRVHCLKKASSQSPTREHLGLKA